MEILDIIIVIVFSIGVIFVGLAFLRQGKDMKSFFAAGGAMPWGLSGLSLFMGFFSAGTFVVWGSIAYTMGWVAITIQWTMALAGFIVGTFIAPIWRRTGALTAAEYIQKRLGRNSQKMYTYLFLVISIFLMASFLYPVAKIVEVSTGLSLDLCIILLGLVCILYVSVGGLWAVIATDIFQFVILTAAVVIVIPLSIDHINGLQNLLVAAPDTFYNLINEDYTLGFIISFGIYNTIFLGGNWAYVQRYTCVKTERDAQKVGWMFGALYLISPVLWMLPPMAYRISNSGLSLLQAEGAYLMMCKEVLPQGILGLMIGGMIFATTSALNSKLNISAGVFTNDVFKQLRPQSSNITLMRIARLSTIALGLVTIAVALLIPKMGGVVNVVISLAALTGVPLYLPVVWTLFSKRQTGTSTGVATLFSLSVNIIFKFITPLMGLTLNRTEEMILGVGLPIFLLLAYELWFILNKNVSAEYSGYQSWEKSNKATHESLSKQQLKLLKQENSFGLRVISFGILFTGICISLIGGIAGDAQSLVISVGVVLILLGWSILRKSKQYKDSENDS